MKTICIDIDGTICAYSEWVDSDTFGSVLPGARENIRKLHDAGWYIIIHSTRADRQAIARFLEKEGIHYDSINQNPRQPSNALGGKPIADVYLDDRAVTFTGDWNKAYSQVLDFKPWENA